MALGNGTAANSNFPSLPIGMEPPRTNISKGEYK